MAVTFYTGIRSTRCNTLPNPIASKLCMWFNSICRLNEKKGGRRVSVSKINAANAFAEGSASSRTSSVSDDFVKRPGSTGGDPFGGLGSQNSRGSGGDVENKDEEVGDDDAFAWRGFTQFVRFEAVDKNRNEFHYRTKKREEKLHFLLTQFWEIDQQYWFCKSSDWWELQDWSVVLVHKLDENQIIKTDRKKI